MIAAQLAKVGIVAKIQNVEWAQWMSGVYTNRDYDLTIISHVEPLDLGNVAGGAVMKRVLPLLAGLAAALLFVRRIFRRKKS